jgi:AcrR family transcriptional regulator
MAETPNIRSRIIDVAIEMIEAGGEASIRVTQIAERIGVSQPALYHHFKDRSELLTVAYLTWYERNLLLDVPPDSMISEVASGDDFFRVFRRSLEWSYAPERAKARSIRVSVLGAAQTNPALKAAINDLNRVFLQSVASNIKVGQENGWVRNDLDATALAYWLNGQITGRLIAEMMDGEVDMNAWDQVSYEAIWGMLRVN